MKIENLSKTYGNRTVLRVHDMTLEPGIIYGVIGANGSGKSTFARVLSGQVKPDAGSKLTDFGGCRVGYMPQRSFGFQMSVLSNVLLTTKRTAADKTRALDLLKDLGIDQLAGKKADRLSGGETARMALARIMMQRYDLLILDEPTAATDIASTLRIEEMITRYRKETGCAVVFISHSLSQARRLADEVLFFCEGVLTEHGPAEAMLHHPQNPETARFLEFYDM